MRGESRVEANCAVIARSAATRQSAFPVSIIHYSTPPSPPFTQGSQVAAAKRIPTTSLRTGLGMTKVFTYLRPFPPSLRAKRGNPFPSLPRNDEGFSYIVRLFPVGANCVLPKNFASRNAGKCSSLLRVKPYPVPDFPKYAKKSLLSIKTKVISLMAKTHQIIRFGR